MNFQFKIYGFITGVHNSNLMAGQFFLMKLQGPKLILFILIQWLFLSNKQAERMKF